MSKSTLRASAAPFAHLFGGARAAKAAGDPPEDKDKDKDAKSKGSRAEDPDDAMDDTETVDGGEDTGVDGDERPDLDDVEDPDDSLDGDAAAEEDDVDPKVKKAARSGRKAERTRWARVMGHSSAAGREASACQLLATTSMDSRQIVATLQTLPKATASAPPAARGPGLRERMESRPAPRLGSDGGKSPDQSFGAQVAAAVSKARG